MALDISAAGTPIGDVATAIMDIDSTLNRVRGTGGGPPDQQPARGENLAAGLVIHTIDEAREVLTGYCTVIYLFIVAWRKACEACGKDVLAEIVPGIVDRLRIMTRTVAPSTIPTMAAMMTAAAMDASPDLWRAQFGEWRPEELDAIQATALLLAEGVNRAHDDPDAAVRIVLDALSRAEEDPGTG